MKKKIQNFDQNEVNRLLYYILIDLHSSKKDIL